MLRLRAHTILGLSFVSAAGAVAVFACATSNDTAAGTDAGPMGPPDASAELWLIPEDEASTDAGSDADADVAPLLPTPCSDAASKYIFLLDNGATLHTFDPVGKTFQTVGAINCPGITTTSPYDAIAVDRAGTVWMKASDTLFQIQTVPSISCTSTSFKSNSPFSTGFGLSFSSDAPDSGYETLYIAGNKGVGLAKIDLSTFAMTLLGSFDGPVTDQQCALTGTSDSKLYGACLPANLVAQIDKESAHILSTGQVDGIDAGDDLETFAAWGGEFYIFFGGSIYLYSPSNQMTTVFMATTPFQIMSAGVSVCAPTHS